MSLFRICAASGCKLGRSGQRYGARFASSSADTARHADLMQEEASVANVGLRAGCLYRRHQPSQKHDANAKTWDTDGLMKYCKADANRTVAKLHKAMAVFHSLHNLGQTVETHCREHAKAISITCQGRSYLFNSHWDTPLTVANTLLLPERHHAVCAKMNGQLIDLGKSLQCDGELEFVLASSPDAVIPLGNLATVLLNQGLERAWKDVLLLQSGVNDDGQFFCDVQRPMHLADMTAVDMACLENFMLEAADGVYSCNMIRASESQFRPNLTKNIKNLFRFDPTRAQRIVDVMNSEASPYELYIHGSYVNVHDSPTALHPSVVKAVAIESMVKRHGLPVREGEREQAVYRFTGRVFSDIDTFRNWLQTSTAFPVDTSNPLCRHAHWKSLRADHRSPMEPTVAHDAYAVDAADDDAQHASDAASIGLASGGADDAATATAAAKRARKKRGSSRVAAIFSPLHNSHLSIAHPLRLSEPPTLAQMELLRTEQAHVFGSRRISPSSMVAQWESLKRKEAQRVASNAESKHHRHKGLMLSRPSDLGSRSRVLSKASSPTPAPLSTII